ncbi:MULTISPECIES: hypothetical protein [Paraburkholderia]|uniref:hypothetical protein n=1 Tax=Paraburkholderia TaxID=1822464 RepID=UPI001039434E|nr:MULTISPECIES: hypothetical protein [Paraburkholderia]
MSLLRVRPAAVSGSGSVPVALQFTVGTDPGADELTRSLPASRLSFVGDYCKRTVACKAVNDSNVGRTARNVVIPIRFLAKHGRFWPVLVLKWGLAGLYAFVSGYRFHRKAS